MKRLAMMLASSTILGLAYSSVSDADEINTIKEAILSGNSSAPPFSSGHGAIVQYPSMTSSPPWSLGHGATNSQIAAGAPPFSSGHGNSSAINSASVPPFSVGHGGYLENQLAKASPFFSENGIAAGSSAVSPPYSTGHGQTAELFSALPPFSVGHGGWIVETNTFGVVSDINHAKVELFDKFVRENEECRERSTKSPDFFINSELGVKAGEWEYTFDINDFLQKIENSDPSWRTT